MRQVEFLPDDVNIVANNFNDDSGGGRAANDTNALAKRESMMSASSLNSP